MRKVIMAVIISAVGVFVIDYFFHLLFSEPMETPAYFLAKMALFLLFSIIFLNVFNLENRELKKVILAGITVSLIWGAYYNILPAVFDFYPFGIPLRGLTFLGMGILGTGIAFGTVHTAAFVGGYYFSKFVMRRFSYLLS